VGYPLAQLFGQIVQAGWTPVTRVISGSGLTVVINTLLSAGAATVLAVLIGAALAVATERAQVPGKSWLRLGICLPILIPPFISAFSWTQAYGRAGLMDKLAGASWSGLFGSAGVVALLTVQSVPLVYLPMASALARQDTLQLERAARASGAGFLGTLSTVTLPLMRPYLASGAALAYIVSASDFGVPSVVGVPGRFSTITTEIYRDLAFASDRTSFSTAIVLAGLLALMAVLFLVLMRRQVFAAAMAAIPAGAPAGGSAPVERPIRVVIALVLTVWIVAVSVLPLASMVLVALIRAYGLPFAIENLTLAHFSDALGGTAGEALVRSVLVSVAAATVAAMLGLAVAIASGRGLLGQVTEVLVALPYAIPGSALAVAIILGFDRWLYGTVGIILLAYVARFWALSSRPVSAAIAGLSPDPIRAARAAGASAWRSFVTGAWPALRPAVLAGWLLVFLTAVHELTVSSLLYTPDTQTLAVVVLNAEQGGDVAKTAAVSVLLTALVLLLAIPLVLIRGVSGQDNQTRR
jgi:iron(III) transport system permease protein